MSEKYLGRFAVGSARRVSDSAYKTKVASFNGEHYSAETEDGQLVVYAHTDEQGRPAQKFGEQGTSGIRSTAGRDTIGGVGSLAGLNELNFKHYAGAGVIARRRA